MMQLIDIDMVIELTSLSRSSIYQLTKSGKFPRQVDFSDLGLRLARWNRDQVVQWIEVRTPEWLPA